MLEVGFDVRPVCFDHPSYALDWFETAADRPAVPGTEVLLRDAEAAEIPQAHRRFLQGPGPSGLQHALPQGGELPPGLASEVVRIAQPGELGLHEPVLPLGHELPVLLPTNLVHRFVQMLRHMELVEDDLGVGARQMGARRSDIGLPHIHGDRLDGIQMLAGQALPETVEAVPRAVIGDIENPGVLQVGDHGNVFMTPLERSLVDSQVTCGLELAPCETPPDSALLDAGRLVPGEMEPLCHGCDRCLLHPVNGQGFEQRREPRDLLGPGHPQLPDAVARTIESGNPRVEHCTILERVQMSPHPFPMIMDRRSHQTVRTNPELLRGQGHPNVHFPLIQPEFHLLHSPRGGQTQQFRIESLFVHEQSSVGYLSDERIPPTALTNKTGHTIAGRAVFIRGIKY